MKSLIPFLFCFLVISCSKEEKKYIYQVQEVYVDSPGADKPNVKESTEYISIAYADVFGKSIGSDLLAQLTTSYVSFGDVSIIEDLIIRNFLADPDAKIPTDSQMRADVELFVKDCYNQFYGREPNAQEVWFFKDKINSNSGLTPEVVFYIFLTSNEYRQF